MKLTQNMISSWNAEQTREYTAAIKTGKIIKYS